MSDFIKSNWRITWDPDGTQIVLLDYGDGMLADPTFAQPHNSELVSFARALSPKGFHFGNVGHLVAFTRAVPYSTLEGGGETILDHLATTQALRVNTLQIKVENGKTYRLDDAVIRDVLPLRSPEHGANILFQYDIAGGNLAEVP